MIKLQTNLAESSQKGFGSKSAVVPMMMMMMATNHLKMAVELSPEMPLRPI
jgi:hypothetical protein